MPHLYFSADLHQVGVLNDDRLDATTERHKLRLDPEGRRPPPSLDKALGDNPDYGIVLELNRGWPGRIHLALAGRALRAGRRVWLYWPAEEALEVLDRQRVRDHWRLWAAVQVYER